MFVVEILSGDGSFTGVYINTFFIYLFIEYLNSESDDGSNSAGSSLPSSHSLDCDLDEVDTEESHNVNGKTKGCVPFLSTKHTLDIKATGKKNRKGEEVKKPSAILEYNAGKDGIDVSDQMASYFSPLRKTIRWYHKLMFEILLNTAVINSLNIYKHFKKQNIQVGAFREMLIESLTQVPSVPVNEDKHSLISTEERTADGRKKEKRDAFHVMRKRPEKEVELWE
ncbi:unnamed protein product [Acanthoscelides obtectus]|uniref:PiggyBac transposable element-derived protein domain-containing protein n=1 Tax=Acanthoscelides obtectus TaxID=200917 RepID=A0A9P0QGN9_ACAOB|nr:unnamed protein product [Acanthoscelides obtectus]CAK1682407.1 hypothetical protein AOBTE_LOCUS33608 [Acanthoscelides obtectus]